MSLSYRTRRRLSLLVLVVGLPLYIVVAVTLTGWLNTQFGRMPIWAELAVYVGLGLLWIAPMKPIFIGVGQADPDMKTTPQDTDKK